MSMDRDETIADVLAPVEPCAKCAEHPPAEAYWCRACGKVEAEDPLPLVGCRCIAAAWLCDGCIIWKSEETADDSTS